MRNAHLLILVIAPAVLGLAGTDGHVSASLCFGAGVAEIMLGQDEKREGISVAGVPRTPVAGLARRAA